ncbi:zinc-dependent alcohol dehydrogenase family protein [Undibacterium terreum]|uniref:enoyl-[acyl-carrier-protein] reductase n=1 Tax=Undibacterium terreum TaxID=1224302 RepID=A0A916XG60_9BURK|nr:zinc-dependent alcohol dehydrogenase family protein [Undibacterium terreum]GGC69478.1 trans-2-enoyl-CoA reductase [Undibacterium terreum]
MRAAQLIAYGNPADGLQFAEVAEVSAPGAGEVLIAVEYSPVNLNDLLVARGLYPLHPELPSVIGNEGAGTVMATGTGVVNVKPGDKVLVPYYSLAWTERVVVPAADLFPLPPDADMQQLAMLGINPPTAALILSEYVDLKPGDWVVQNAANSGVGRAVIAFAKARGLKTINLVRRPELIAELEEAGGDLVLLDAPEAAEAVKSAVGTALPRLAIDAVGGTSTTTLASIVAAGGTIVCYAALGRAPLALRSIDVIFKRITLRGFFLSAPEMASKIRPALEEGAALISAGKLHAPVSGIYPLSAIKEAVAHVERGGKVLMDIKAV